MLSNTWRVVCLLLIMLLAVSCMPTTTDTPASETQVVIKTPVVIERTDTPRPTEKILLQPTETVENTPTVVAPELRVTDHEFQQDDPYHPRPLSSSGPWMVYAEGWDELGRTPFYVANLDGSSKTHLFSIRTHTNLRSRFCELSPDTSYLSCQSMRDVDSLMGLEKEIVVYHLPDQGIVRIPAVSDEIVAGLQAIGKYNDPNLELDAYTYSDEFTAIKASGQMRWSPDSRYLAYIAAVDGPISDVYVFDTETQQTKRLTNGLTQASIMSWSPDSRWIIHFSWNKGHQTDMDGSALPAVNAIWAANPEFGAIVKLADVEWDSIGEYVKGWISDDEFFVVSDEGNGIGAPVSHLRSINITTNTSSMWYEDQVDGIAVDPISQTILFIRYYFSDEPPGLMLLPRNGTPILIDDREWDYVYWVPEMEGFKAENWVDNEELFIPLENSPNEDFPLEVSISPEVSPNGEFLVFIGRNSAGQKGIRIYDAQGELLDHILAQNDNPTVRFYWNPDESGFWFLNTAYVMEYRIPEKTLNCWHISQGSNSNVEDIIGLVIP